MENSVKKWVFLTTTCYLFIIRTLFKVNHRQSTSKEFSDWLIREKNLAMLPLTAFYGDEHKSQSDGYVRLCFNKVMSNHMRNAAHRSIFLHFLGLILENRYIRSC